MPSKKERMFWASGPAQSDVQKEEEERRAEMAERTQEMKGFFQDLRP